MDIQYFKKLLEERKKQIVSNIDVSNEDIENLKDIEVNDEGDYAALCTDNMIEHALQEKQIKELEEINYALKKIEIGEYGICEMCGEPIKPLRLKIKPFAKYCIICREIIEKEPK